MTTLEDKAINDLADREGHECSNNCLIDVDCNSCGAETSVCVDWETLAYAKCDNCVEGIRQVFNAC